MSIHHFLYRSEDGFEIEINGQANNPVVVIFMDGSYSTKDLKKALDFMLEVAKDEAFLTFSMTGTLSGNIFYATSDINDMLNSINEEYSIVELINQLFEEIKSN